MSKSAYKRIFFNFHQNVLRKQQKLRYSTNKKGLRWSNCNWKKWIEILRWKYLHLKNSPKFSRHVGNYTKEIKTPLAYLCQFHCWLEMGDGTDQHVIRYQTSFGQGHIRLIVWTRRTRARCNKSESVNITFLLVLCMSHVKRSLPCTVNGREHYLFQVPEVIKRARLFQQLSIKLSKLVARSHVSKVNYEGNSTGLGIHDWNKVPRQVFNWLAAMYLHHLLHWPPNVSRPQDFPDRTNRDPSWELGKNVSAMMQTFKNCEYGPPLTLQRDSSTQKSVVRHAIKALCEKIRGNR